VPSTALSNAGPDRLLWTTAVDYALPYKRIKHLLMNTALFEPTMTILVKGGVIGHLLFQR
jgi:hypothetical protein